MEGCGGGVVEEASWKRSGGDSSSRAWMTWADGSLVGEASWTSSRDGLGETILGIMES